jgi:hypothetical protein
MTNQITVFVPNPSADVYPCVLDRCWTSCELDDEKAVATLCFNWRARQDSNLWPLPSEGSTSSLHVVAVACINPWSGL